MNIFSTCYRAVFIVNAYLALPTMILFLLTGIILTIWARFIQIRAFPRFWHIITSGIKKGTTGAHTISSLRALLTAMATTIGMGNIVGPPMAIAIGGPGALFWILVYICFGVVTRYTEVTFAVYSRTTSPKGDIIGGPTQYLALVRPWLGTWYAFLTIFLFAGWSSIQVNTLSCIWAQEGVPPWISGIIAVSILLVVVLGGVDRIGYVASRIVPLQFIIYLVFASIILLKNPVAVLYAFQAVLKCAFTKSAGCGGLVGITFFTAMREGIYKSIYTTESGLGTSSISHALANVEYPSDQGILALYSGLADMLLCTLSGLLTLVTGVWLLTGNLNNTLIFEAFKLHAPYGVHYVLMASVLLFVITALIGNTYNGSQSFASFTNYRYVKAYYIVVAVIAFSGCLMEVPLLWGVMDIMLTSVAVPNLLGLLYLAYTYPDILRITKT